MNDIFSKSRRHLSLATLLASVLSLSSCGGGGGSAADDPPAAITEANAQAVIADAYRAASALYDVVFDGASLLVTGVVTEGAKVSFNLTTFSTKTLFALAAKPASAGALVTGVVITDTEPCSGGGSLSYTVDFVDDNTLSPGDSGRFSFTNCVESGVALNGTLSFVVLAASGTTSFRASFTYSNLRIALDGDEFSIDGGMTIQAAVSYVPRTTYDISATGSLLTVTSQNESQSLAGFESTLRLDEGTNTFVYTFQGNMSGTGLPGTVAVTTPTAFSGINGNYPGAGTMVVRAANGSAARLSAVSTTSVSIGIDADGNGTYELSVPMTWAELDAL
jgi:hypothetical protein